MRQQVRDVFVRYTEPLEGRTDWLYCDVLGLVTTAYGVLVDPVPLAEALPWRWPVDGRQATRAEIRTEWQRVKDRQDLRLKGGGAYRGVSALRLSAADVEVATMRKLEGMVERLRHRFTEWDAWPADAQLAVLSLSWACGPAFAYPKLTKHLKAQDWRAAAQESDIRPDHGTIRERNRRQPRLGADLLSVQRRGVPLWRVLHHQCVEHAEEPWEPRARLAARRGQLHHTAQAAGCR
jgi:hypothetical protein